MLVYAFEAAPRKIISGTESSAKGLIDFKNNVYSYQGTTLAASDIVDQTGWIGTNGLEVPASASAGAAILYAPLQTFLAAGQFTIVFEVEVTESGHPIIFRIESADEDLFAWLEWWGIFLAHDQSQESGIYTSRDIQDNDHWQTGTYKIGMTRTDDRLSISVHGAAAITDISKTVTIPVGARPVTAYWLGGLNWTTYDAINIHWIRVYDAVSDNDLAILSA